ncbi:MAG: hypothetical protein GY859_19345, partial [Desulfobacterales bacterium]|nr:hypothetical protein [Desulfobacterales bacterium]
MRVKRAILFITICLIVVILLCIFHYKIASPRGESIHIAFGGPMSGDGAAAGKLMTRAIQSYLDRVNDNGGV